MKKNNEIIIQLVEHGSQNKLQLPDVYFDIRFFVSDRFRYCFWFGPSDSNGQLRITYDEVERKRCENSHESLMDYNTPVEELDDRIEISIPNVASQKKAYEIATRWAGKGTPPPYAKAWLESNNKLISAEPLTAKVSSGLIYIGVSRL
ncbi:hypothetical protein [Cerasicoccus arenae]|uniref:Uncharacterized protein n=1 Tax=Cerasicoccus arenae TaxID=424488 RepID=A0A8J3DK98_9BACT|nr:hypothetical protein [Cerasicoccus arenae]MBK1860081.1 hypothetical protein [Cerasicoccus arenae]GHC14183.1 hypothetical protein GCM10007047_34260 [Cerasicoccus arenae]